MAQDLDLFVLWRKVVPKNWKMIIVLPLIAGLFSLLISIYIIKPLYTASATIIIMQPPEKQAIYNQDIQASRMLAETYSIIALSSNVVESTAQIIDFPIGTNETDRIIGLERYKDPKIITLVVTDSARSDILETTMGVERFRDTEVIRLNVTDADPQMASDIANAWADIFKEIVLEIMEVENVNIINRAVSPQKPIYPNVLLNIVTAILFGLGGAFGLAFLIEFLDKKIKDPAEAQNLLKLPVIGIMPITKLLTKETSLFEPSDLNKLSMEALRTIWTNIQYSSVDKAIKQILIAGINSKCDQSTIVANLGITIAGFGNAVLIVDGDLRRPTLHDFFNINNNNGLSSLIFEEELELKKVLRICNNNLAVLPSGPIPPYPTELLASNQMKDLTASFTEQFEYVIYNSPPLITFSDAAVLSKITDATIVVLDYGKVNKNDAVKAVDQLNKIQTNIIGIVINNMPRNRTYNRVFYYNDSNGEEHKQ